MVHQLISSGTAKGYPMPKPKLQPWKQYHQLKEQSKGSPLLVACPKAYDYNTSGLGGV